MVFKYLDSVSSLILLTCFIPTRLANLEKQISFVLIRLNPYLGCGGGGGVYVSVKGVKSHIFSLTSHKEQDSIDRCKQKAKSGWEKSTLHQAC